MIVLAAALAIRVQAPCEVQKPLIEHLRSRTTLEGWSDGEDSFERERIVAGTMVSYLQSLRVVIEEFGRKLQWSVNLLTFGLVLVAISAVWTVTSI